MPARHANVNSWTTVPTQNMSQINQEWQADIGKGADGKNFSEKFMQIVMNDQFEQKWLEYVGVTGLDLENTTMDTEETVIALKKGLRLRFPGFMANIVKILLFRGEEKLACLLTAYFEVALDMEMFKCAVENRFFEWLQYVYVFKKNWVGKKGGPAARRVNATKRERVTLGILFT